MFAPKIQFMWFLFAISFNINKVSGIPSLETQLIANSELPRYMYLQIVWTLTKFNWYRFHAKTTAVLPSVFKLVTERPVNMHHVPLPSPQVTGLQLEWAVDLHYYDHLFTFPQL